jgi:hypothetical protein
MAAAVVFGASHACSRKRALCDKPRRIRCFRAALLEQPAATAQAWIGRRRRQRLAWAADPALHRLAATVTTDIQGV